MTDRPILFSAPMVRALLDGRKTQTRRVLKRHPLHKPEPHTIGYSDGELICRWKSGIWHDVKSPIAIGDRLWVRENHYLTDDGESEYAVYAANAGDVDDHLENMQTTMTSHPSIDWSRHIKLRPSIHMPRWASRLTLVVTDVRVERLQDISAEDVIAEGVECETCIAMNQSACHRRGCPASLLAFRSLWTDINGPDAWDANPWVAAYTFTVHKCNIDQMEKAA